MFVLKDGGMNVDNNDDDDGTVENVDVLVIELRVVAAAAGALNLLQQHELPA